MPILANIENCTGCTACYSVCPKDAINMKGDALGFKFPEIDKNACIECKLCEKSCPIINNSKKLLNNSQYFYAGQLKSLETLMECQSGGAFYAIASIVLSKNGIVYGASFDEDLKVGHLRIDNDKEIFKLTKSKYVQSDLKECFKNLRDDLKNGKLVLFSGTPCQIAGLRSFITDSLQKNLITTDLICHGVPGPLVYEQYLKYLERKHSKRIKKFIFRDKKRFGWRTARETAIFTDDTKVSSYKYNFLFLEKNLIIRPSCFQCEFCSLSRVGDVTIADCWGWEKIDNNDLDDSNGISLLIVNTSKGHKIIESLHKSMHLFEVPIAPLMQRNLSRPTQRPYKLGKVREDFIKGGFALIYKKYGNTPINLIRYKVNDYLGEILRRLKHLSKL